MPDRAARAVPDAYKAMLPIYAAKTATIAVSLLLACGVFAWARSLYGINAGFLALTLYVLDPNVIAHSRVVHQNILESCAIFAALYFFWKLVQAPSRTNAALAILAFSSAQITRFTALYLVPIYLLLLIGAFGPNLRRLAKDRDTAQLWSYLKVASAYIVLFGLSAIVLINIGFSGDGNFTRLGWYTFTSRAFTAFQSDAAFLRAVPVPLPSTYVKGLDFARQMQESSTVTGPPYLNGRLGIENGQKKGFKSYYLVALLYKVPLATQITVLLATLGVFLYRAPRQFWQAEAFLIVPAVVFVAVFSFSHAQIGVRYILMIFPLLFVFASRIMVRWSRSGRYQVGVGVLLGYLLISNLSYYPHYLSYFNELMPDRKLSYTVLADSNLDWGQNTSYLVKYLQDNPDVMFSSVAPQRRQLPPERLFDPEHPKAGFVVISANELLGITAPPERYRWLREKLKPVAHVAYSFLVFEVRNTDLP